MSGSVGDEGDYLCCCSQSSSLSHTFQLATVVDISSKQMCASTIIHVQTHTYTHDYTYSKL